MGCPSIALLIAFSVMLSFTGVHGFFPTLRRTSRIGNSPLTLKPKRVELDSL
jgi:hypothetical protein